MTLVYPQALLLLLPLGLLLWFTGRLKGPALWLRVALLLTLTLALARPEWRIRSAGSDVVVVVDRSRSMPPRSEATAEELVRLLEPQRRTGDRLGVISFGRDPRVEAPLSAESHFGGFTASIDGEASNLSSALDAAGDLIPPDRSGRVLVISDGRASGLDARAAARRLAARGIPVDTRWLGREDAALDVAVSSLSVPPSVATAEPFLLTATLKSSGPAEATLVLLRNGKPLVKTQRALGEGPTVLSFRDLVDAPGLAAYELKVEVKGDGVVENDIGRAVARVEGPPRVLLLTDKPQGTLARSLAGAHVNVEVKAPFPVTMQALEGVGAVVLEDVEAGRLTENGLHVLAQFVKEAGGGLVMTGGRRSFGEGGYRKSPVEDVLPVSLEIREEQRKAAVAISIIMDCSCSMGVRVPDGRTKMELAAEGVVGALQLLNPQDEASVHMVDTEDHPIFALSPVSAGLPLDKVARGFSGGGGIYVGVGLRVAKKEILASQKATRHVLLFSDAADSEEPDDYRKTIADLTAEGVTVSVIGMGTTADPDAALLREVATRGNGRIYFAEDVMSLPRIFSQETIAVARSSFVEEPTDTAVAADLTQLGKLPTAAAPRLGGYNLTYSRPQASVGLRTSDGNQAPVVAFWPRGTGRVAALMGEVDGKDTGDFRAWEGQRALLEQLVRWVMPPLATQLDAVARAGLSGNELHVTLDFDPNAPPPGGTPTLVLLSGDARQAPLELPMRWEDEDRVGAHWVLPGSGTWHPVVRLGNRLFRAPPVTLPWAPEFEPAPVKEGKALLASVAVAGNGVERLAMVGLFKEAVESEAAVPLAPWLVAFAVALLTGEVFVRRFFSGPRAVRRKPVAAPQPAVATASPTAGPSAPRPAPQPAAPRPSPAAPSPAPAASAEENPAPPEKKDVLSALAQARDRAKKRTGR
ncbi:MAG: VWA domain-containing protein [Myxococcales bacterium]|nr:VWA domain-containing protein [Myxococcales bacterium]